VLQRRWLEGDGCLHPILEGVYLVV